VKALVLARERDLREVPGRREDKGKEYLYDMDMNHRKWRKIRQRQDFWKGKKKREGSVLIRCD
jgi:hypothetical protein